VLAGALLAAACSGDDAAPASSPPSTSAAPTTTRPDDGVFRVGAVIPNGGDVPDLGVSLRAALNTARDDINTIGVRGQQVSLEIRDEGDSPASARTAVQELLDAGVDVIVGPTSSLHLLATLPSAVKADVLTCSPTASAMSLDDFPDAGLFFRTVPSDSLQAAAIARMVSDTGSGTAVIAYVDDAYGRPFAAAVRSKLEGGGPTVSPVAFPSDDAPPAELVDAVVAAEPDVVVVLADGTLGPSIISAIDAALADAPVPRGPNNAPVQYIVNDAMRRTDATAAMSADLVARISGVAPRAYPTAGSDFEVELQLADPQATGLYAMNAYDCLTLIALGADAAGSFDGKAIHDQLVALTTSGRSCASFSQCTTFAQTTPNIDYDGPSGVLTLDANGDPSATRFQVFRTDPATGQEVTSVLSIGSTD
jgi:branched-chain amino acid transport system substrate-binding protein